MVSTTVQGPLDSGNPSNKNVRYREKITQGKQEYKPAIN